ncbi:MAG: hypothetical protein HQM00_01715, partial [Magnetococcales bacterium]|nr:hypothetical protein [Magnetococcales bacterium]
RKGLKSVGEAVRALVDLAERGTAAPAAPAVTPASPQPSPPHASCEPRAVAGDHALRREVKALLQDLKSRSLPTRSGGAS